MNERYPQNLIITVDDFVNSDCQKIINNIVGDSYSEYWSILSKKARERIDNGELKSGKILWIIADACSMMLNPNSKNEPFKPFAIMYQTNSRSAIVDDFTEDEIDFFENILEFCSDYRIKSRFADILWLKKSPKNIQHIEIAIENYQQFSLAYDNILDDSKSAWERAIKLSLWTKKSLELISNNLLAQFEKVDFADGYYLSYIEELLLLSQVDKRHYEEIIDKLELFANKFKTNKDFHRARSYFESCKNWTDDIDKLNKFIIEIAELYVLEAKSVNTLASGHFYENAIKEYRKVAGKHREKYDININDRIDEIHQEMNKSNLLSLDYMQPMDLGEVNLTELTNYSIKEVSDKNFEEALYRFANIYSSKDVNKLHKEATKSTEKFSISKLFGATHFASDGRVISKRAGMDFLDKESKDYEDSIFHEMVQSYDLEIDLITKASIIPAFQQLLFEHRITKDDLYSLCSTSSIIPAYRTVFWIEGLYFGFENNFIVSTHLLIPQIEHLVRVKMKEKGIKTSTISTDGIETENGLSTLLDNEKITEVLDETILFEFKALLTEQIGKNFRNNVAHGLCEVNTLRSIHAIYFWWLCLKLVLNNVPNGEDNK
ncbi:DUF4209 domain-containing protein [Candidatus Sulfurimonas marisnigri]|uniref:DUF4209 domain-containing protein n=1 Tax=Candidatus Sulfurimonas marisnigri TaxID=2740405 RepID=A0A7S7M0J4_9BACT|nr:DUF4209 domain-containing protein [Candidatus Sulfurimonas marisnigri]QOY54004.1 DUF4209 domain-containing protein [Candidatus Sulfurimonas marisnigri]